jgi:2-keto-4-pentenoate hydratase/2-oxohepta-3-ene-1,7-dioic acid hydratase in catechol pathway
MKLLRVGPSGEERPAVLDADGRILDAASITPDYDGAFFAAGGVDRIASALAAGSLPALPDGLRVGPPIARPGKVVCIGLNYRDHAAETGAAIPVRPIMFMKDPATVIGPYDEVLIPRRSVKTDWEVELGVVIGTQARYLDSPDDALACVAGYAVSNDVSEREFQLELSHQWDIGKSCETFNPLGPWLVTADDLPAPQKLGLRLSVNGVQRQNGTTADMVFDVAYLIWYLSQYLVLNPGDLINTGTPAGVALGMAEPAYLREGDHIELEIDGLGHAAQRMGAA